MSPVEEADVALAAVRAHCRVLKLPTVARESDTLARQALADGQHPLAFLRALLEAEVATRAEHAVERRLQAASPSGRERLFAIRLATRPRSRAGARRRPRTLRVDRRFPRAQRRASSAQSAPARRTSATALGIEAIKRGHHVVFYRASDLVRALTEARDSRILSRLQDRLRRASLLLLDELGFVPFEKVGGELLFDVLSARHERAATVITSNLAFSEWNRVFGDDKLTAALLDRLAQHADVLVDPRTRR